MSKRALADELFALEYRAMVDSTAHALSYAQSIVKWSIGAFGVILGAGMVAARAVQSSELNQGAVSVVTLSGIAVFSGLLPGLVLAASWTWLGELLRLGRVSAYIRAVELELDRAQVRTSFGVAPLRFHRHINDRLAGKMGVQVGAYLGTAGLFAATLVFSLLSATWWHGALWGANPTAWDSIAWIWFTLPWVLALVFLIVSGCLTRRIFQLLRHIPDLASGTV